MSSKAPPSGAVDLLSQISGVSKPAIMDIWAEVKANSARLESCPRHGFAPVPVKLGQKVTCLACGGTMGLVDVGWYIKGYRAAGGHPDDIWPGWHKEHNTHG